MQKIFRFFIIFLCVVVLIFSVNWKKNYIKLVLYFIPDKDKEYLREFFQYLNYCDGFPFVLNETKPLTTKYLPSYDLLEYSPDKVRCLSFVCYLKEFYICFNPLLLKIYKGIDIWEKYSYLFPSRNIYISITESRFPDPAIIVIIFNERLLKKTINKHINDFSKILGKEFNSDSFIENLKKNSTDFHRLLKNNDYLMGLIYGFGRENAQAFQLRVESNLYLIPPYLVKQDYPSPQPNLTFSDLGSFWGRKNPINHFDPFFTSLPGFVINLNCSENQKLREEYIKAYKEINKSQKEAKDILFWSLMKLME